MGGGLTAAVAPSAGPDILTSGARVRQSLPRVGERLGWIWRVEDFLSSMDGAGNFQAMTVDYYSKRTATVTPL